MAQSRSGQTDAQAKEGREIALLDRVRRSDRAAFSELYRLYHPRLYGYLRRLLADPGTVEEILDDVMLVVWKDVRKFRGRGAVSSWIFGIAYRKALTAMRSERRYQLRIDRTTDTDSIACPSSQHDDWIRAALMQLSPEHRQVVELTYFSGFAYREIAEIADCPVNTVKTRMFHAKRRLRVLLPALAGRPREQNRERA